MIRVEDSDLEGGGLITVVKGFSFWLLEGRLVQFNPSVCVSVFSGLKGNKLNIDIGRFCLNKMHACVVKLSL